MVELTVSASKGRLEVMEGENTLLLIGAEAYHAFGDEGCEEIVLKSIEQLVGHAIAVAFLGQKEGEKP